MSVKNMMSSWVRNNDSRLVKKQTSIRLPVHAAAKIEALCEMYPSKTKSEIITSLLTASLDEVLDSFIYSPGNETTYIDGEKYIIDAGPRTEYMNLANKHFEKLEKELGNPSPERLFNEPFSQSETTIEMMYEGKS